MALLLGLAWLGLTGCDDEFVSGGDGGAGGTSSGTLSGSATGTDTGTGSPTGTDTGSPTGTTSGTSGGNATGTSAGTANGTITGLCPDYPCVANATDFHDCTPDDDECVRNYCLDESCCSQASWVDAECGLGAVRTCGTDLCSSTTDVCGVLAGGPVCNVMSSGSCTFSFQNLGPGQTSCHAVCGARGARCLGGVLGEQCPLLPLTTGCSTSVDQSFWLHCTCALDCTGEGAGLCEPGTACVGSPTGSGWACEP